MDGESGKVLKFTLGKKKKKALQTPKKKRPPRKIQTGRTNDGHSTRKDEGDERDEEVDARQVLEGLKLSHFIEWMKIEVFDESIAVAASAGETASKREDMAGEHEKGGNWSVLLNGKSANPEDGFTITVPGAKDSMRVRCDPLRNDPPKFTLSGMLADIIGKEEESAGRVMYALWSRCKAPS